MMDNGVQWDIFLTIIAFEYKLTTAEKEFFSIRFKNENLEKNDGDISRIVMGNDNQEQAYRKRKKNVYAKFKGIINHDGKDKFPILLQWLKQEYQNRHFPQQITKPLQEFEEIGRAHV